MLDPLNLEQTTPSTCFETAGEMRTQTDHGTGNRIWEVKQTFAIRILSMLVLRESGKSARAPLSDKQPLGLCRLNSNVTRGLFCSAQSLSGGCTSKPPGEMRSREQFGIFESDRG